MLSMHPGLGALLLLAIPVQLVAQDGPGEPAEVQRLFTTPAQRLALETLRSDDEVPPVVDEIPGATGAPEATVSVTLAPGQGGQGEQQADLIYRLHGIVRRAQNGHTVWLNDNALDADQLPDNMELISARAGLRISQPLTGRSFELKPGQVLNLTTGQLYEYYEAPAAAPPENPAGAAVDDSAAVETVTGNGADGTAQTLEEIPGADPVAPEETEAEQETDREEEVGVQ